MGINKKYKKIIKYYGIEILKINISIKDTVTEVEVSQEKATLLRCLNNIQKWDSKRSVKSFS